MSYFRKPPKEYTINGEKVMISPLKAGTILRIKGVSKAAAEAIAKLRSVAMTDYENIKNSKPAPVEGDAEAIEYYEKVTHKAPDASMVTLNLRNKQEGIEALFDCLFQNNLLDEILRTSIDVFKGVPKGALFDPESEQALDLPMAMEYFTAVFEVNSAGFSDLGKFSRLLKTVQGAVKDQAPEPEENSSSSDQTKS